MSVLEVVVQAAVAGLAAHHEQTKQDRQLVEQYYRQRFREPLDIACACAVHDKPFGARFEYEYGCFELKSTFPIEDRRGRGHFIENNYVSVPANRVNLGALVCPYCRNGNFFHCNGCQTWVCRGRKPSSRDFICSCGNHGRLGEIFAVNGTVGSRQSLPRPQEPRQIEGRRLWLPGDK